MKKRSKAIILSFTAVVLSYLLALFIYKSIGKANLARCRAEIISEIEKMGNNQSWLAQKITTVNVTKWRDKQPVDNWFTDHLMLMRNGDKLVYCYRSSKEDYHN